jgi:hypothetical protein
MTNQPDRDLAGLRRQDSEARRAEAECRHGDAAYRGDAVYRSRSCRCLDGMGSTSTQTQDYRED